jgi:hypothetical protein
MTEQITLTIRGNSYTRTVPTAVVDLMFAAFVDAYKTQHWPKTEDGEYVDMTDAEFYALCLRKHTLAVASGYAAKLDKAITPNTDALAPIAAEIDQ